jgi:hypothetical protein
MGKHPGTGKTFHAVQVGTYKEIDTYADELNAEDLNLYKSPVALIDPYTSDELNFIRFEFDPEEAAERLKWMRKWWEEGRST